MSRDMWCRVAHARQTRKEKVTELMIKSGGGYIYNLHFTLRRYNNRLAATYSSLTSD